MKVLITMIAVLAMLMGAVNGCAWLCKQDMAKINQLGQTVQAGYGTFADLAGKDPAKGLEYIVLVDQGLSIMGPYLQTALCPPKEVIAAAQVKVDAALAVKPAIP